MVQPSPLLETVVCFQIASSCAFDRRGEPPKAPGKRRLILDDTGRSRKVPAGWAVRCSSWLGAARAGLPCHGLPPHQGKPHRSISWGCWPLIARQNHHTCWPQSLVTWWGHFDWARDGLPAIPYIQRDQGIDTQQSTKIAPGPCSASVCSHALSSGWGW